MTTHLAFKHLQEMISFIGTHPNSNQMAKFLSRMVDPLGSIAGISIFTVGENGFLRYLADHGFVIELDRSIPIAMSDDNPLCIALRTGDIQISDMSTLYQEHVDATHPELQAHYLSGLAIPVNNFMVIGVLSKSSVADIRKHYEYFECIQTLLLHWLNEFTGLFFHAFQKGQGTIPELSVRQERILELIKQNKSNTLIGDQLGFSESLIRQESRKIYQKLGVSGRKDLTQDSATNNDY